MASVYEYIEQNRQSHLEELKEFLRIPSVSTKSEHKPDIERACNWVMEKMRAAGIENIVRHETKGHPLVTGDWLHAAGKPTILLYGHYDVQPAEPFNLWTTPPFEPSVREGNLYARGAVDDKGQVHIHLKALEAYKKVEGKFPINIKMLIEGEEEVGSENLYDFVKHNLDKLKNDALVVSDSGMLKKGCPSITYGLRGLAYFQVGITGPVTDLHSGTFGGAVANPITTLAEMISKLHDKRGRITIPGFYKDVVPLTGAERKAFAKLPWKESDFKKTVGTNALVGEAGFSTLERIWARPTLELNGIWGGYTGEGAKTVLPSKAYAKLSTRLVPNQDPIKVSKALEKYLRQLAPKGVQVEFKTLSTGRPWCAPYKHPIFQAAITALEKGFGKKAVFIREGGSIPFVTHMYETFGKPCVLMGFGHPEENAHAPNEHLFLENYFGGIKSVAHFYEELSKVA
ncbi:MAG TPA: dipeptidase [Candidatus Acidoferrales bacterium]